MRLSALSGMWIPSRYLLIFSSLNLCCNFRTAATLQRYDALSQWLVYEIIETDDFDNSRLALPEQMVKGMAKMGYIHTSLQVQEATYGLQGMYIEYYMKAMFAAPFANNSKLWFFRCIIIWPK